MGGIAKIATGIGDVLTGGAFSAKKARKRVKRQEREAEKERLEMTAEERSRRRSLQRAALERQPSLFDMLSGPRT